MSDATTSMTEWDRPSETEAGLTLRPSARQDRRFNLAPLPFQFPSLSHLDSRVEAALIRARDVEGLAPGTLRGFKYAYANFRRFLRETKAEDGMLAGQIRDQIRQVEAWVAWLRGSGRSRTTISNYYRSLAGLFRRLEESDGLVNPLSFLKPPAPANQQPRFLTRKAAELLLRTVRNHPWDTTFERSRNLAIVGLMLFAGLRRSEVLRLEYADVSPDAGTIRVLRGKGRNGGRDRTAYMTPQLRALLSDYGRERKARGVTCPPYIASQSGDRPVGEVTIRRIFKVVSRAVGMRVTPHMLRHTFATLLRQAGVPDRVAMDLLGHRSLEMLQRYSHVESGEHLREAGRLKLDVELGL